MEKKKSNQKKQADNGQGKSERAVNSVPEGNQNQHYNVKKVALGPNTKR